MPRLILHLPHQQEQVREFREDPLIVGRSDACTIRIDEEGVSPRHFSIERTKAGNFKLIDLETAEGTAVNGEKVNVHPLEHGDQISIGETTLIFDAPELLNQQDTDRIGVLRPRKRRRPLRRRRIPLRPPVQEKVFTLEDLRVVLDSLMTEGGTAAFEEIRKMVDQLSEEHRGTPLYESLIEERDRLYRMLDINKLINSEHHVNQLLEVILDTVVELSGAERAFLILREDDTLRIRIARNFDREEIKKPEFKISHSIAEEVLRTGEPILSVDAMNDPNLPAAGSVTDLKLRSIACLPFRSRNEVIGGVYFDNRFETHAFLEADLPLLQGFADQAAIAIENARLFEENQIKQEELRQSRDEIRRLNDALRERVEKQYEELRKIKRAYLDSQKDMEWKHDFSSIIGNSRALREVFSVLDRILDTNQPILIQGESGTGKELVARAIHFNSSRAKSGTFVGENCGAIPDSLIESELFGHEKGAFTGAIATKNGLFELAHKGTLFLDEIGDTSLEMQKKLLRSLQEGEIRRVGGREIIRTDIRLVSASNRDLAELVKSGEFREDLFYRVNVVKITLPPLRERKEDIPALVDHFLELIARENQNEKLEIEEEAVRILKNHSWPGNIRELENELRRGVALSEKVITAESLRDEIRSEKAPIQIPQGSALKDIVREATSEVESRVITKVLEDTDWRKSEAARILGISRPTLDSKIETYKLERS